MKQYIIQIAVFSFLFMAISTPGFAGKQRSSANAVSNTNAPVSSHHEEPTKANHFPQGTKSTTPVEKAHAHIPSWDELAHIHHFHQNRLRKIKRHFKKSVILSKLFLFICHAAVLFISYLHVTH